MKEKAREKKREKKEARKQERIDNQQKLLEAPAEDLPPKEPMNKR